MEKRVAVYNNNTGVIETMSSLLAGEGLKMVAVTGRAQLQELLRAQEIQLLLLDVELDGRGWGEGIEMIHDIRNMTTIPIIIISAQDAETAKIMALNAGADDYVTKPFNVEILILRMRKLIDLSKKRKAKSLIDPEPSEIAITSLDEKLVENAIKYVEANIGRCDLSVEELSRGLGMSRVHLYKKLLQITGKTPIEFIRVIRLKRAAQMLRESQQNVSEIAYQLGFNNPKYFSKYFKDEFGVLPSVYQEREGR